MYTHRGTGDGRLLCGCPTGPEEDQRTVNEGLDERWSHNRTYLWDTGGEDDDLEVLANSAKEIIHTRSLAYVDLVCSFLHLNGDDKVCIVDLLCCASAAVPSFTVPDAGVYTYLE